MKTRLAFGVLMVSFACGFETGGNSLAQNVDTESSGLKQGWSQPEVVRIPITLENPEANAGLDPSGIGYPGWSAGDWGQGYYRTRIAYDATLNSNVFNVLTYDPQSGTRGTYAMYQRVHVESMSADARQAVSEGYPIECQAELNVSYEYTEDRGNLEMWVDAFDNHQNGIDSCSKVVSIENRWQTAICGPIASTGMESFYVSFYCRSSNNCKIDKVKCSVVKRAGFSRFKPVGIIGGAFDGLPSM